MSDIEITIRLPEAMVERAKAIGMTDDEMANALQAEIERREAMQVLDRHTEQLGALIKSGTIDKTQMFAFLDQLQAERTPAIQAEAARRLKEITDDLWSMEPAMTMEEINEEIHLAREERIQREKMGQAE